jgi:sodium/bile acid cotransporter 7
MWMFDIIRKTDWFFSGMIVTIFIAWLFPGPGSEGSGMHPELVTKIGVALIFFLYGLTLSFGAMKDGAKQWRIHTLLQAVTFIFFPVLGIIFYKSTEGIIDSRLQLGFFYLCALPSTVSSSVVMTAAAKGNIPIAMFNATLSSLLGIILTPFLVGLVLHQSGQDGDLNKSIMNLCEWLLLPFIIGHVLEPRLGDFARRHKRYINKIDRLTILLLVYTSFCDSFVQHIWSTHAVQGMTMTFIATVFLFFLILALLWVACDRLGIKPEFRSAIVFCGTKKSLVSGVPMARIIFSGYPGPGLILLPIMLYHPLQLFICGPLASYWAQEKEKSLTS